MKETLYIDGEAGLHLAVSKYLSLSKDIKTAFLIGDLGAGKTTFVKHLVTTLGTQDEISSPTYSLVNEYETKVGKLFHIDLYRLDDVESALDIGIEDYLFSGNYCLVEWPQIIEELVDDVIVIRIETEENGKRKFSFEVVKRSL